MRERFQSIGSKLFATGIGIMMLFSAASAHAFRRSPSTMPEELRNNVGDTYFKKIDDLQELKGKVAHFPGVQSYQFADGDPLRGMRFTIQGVDQGVERYADNAFMGTVILRQEGNNSCIDPSAMTHVDVNVKLNGGGTLKASWSMDNRGRTYNFNGSMSAFRGLKGYRMESAEKLVDPEGYALAQVINGPLQTYDQVVKEIVNNGCVSSYRPAHGFGLRLPFISIKIR